MLMKTLLRATGIVLLICALLTFDYGWLNFWQSCGLALLASTMLLLSTLGGGNNHA